MGNVACCKKPNELIEDQEVYKKSTIRKTTKFQNDQSEPINPFLETNYFQFKNFNPENQNNILDLENNPNNNMIQSSSKIDHKDTNGPSDNLRKRKNKKGNNINSNNNNYLNQKTINESERMNISANILRDNNMNNNDNNNNKFINSTVNQNSKDLFENANRINNEVNNNNINMEKIPDNKFDDKNNNNLDEINKEENKLNQIDNNIDNDDNDINMNNSNREPVDHERNREKKIERINN